MTKFQIIYGSDSGLEKQALRILYETLGDFVNYTIAVQKADSVTEKEFLENNLILLGTPESNPVLKQLLRNESFSNADEAEGYCIKIMQNPFSEKTQLIIISGFDSRGVLYGAVDFKSYYITYAKNTDDHAQYFRTLFADEPLPEYEKISVPSVKQRGIWTWGHVIYDWRKYIENIARLKMNTCIIWNDYIPINISEIIEYAHEFGIAVYLGFSWGWNEARPGIKRKIDISDSRFLDALQDSIVTKYKTQYAKLGMDGIYFQSFTETNSDSANGVIIAEQVVRLVNSTANELFHLNKNLKLMFGLHATGVREKLNYIKNTDERIMIVWEDCGAFPFHYNPSKTQGFEETCKFAKKSRRITWRKRLFRYGTQGVYLFRLVCFRASNRFVSDGMSFQRIYRKTNRRKNKTLELCQYVLDSKRRLCVSNDKANVCCQSKLFDYSLGGGWYVGSTNSHERCAICRNALGLPKNFFRIDDKNQFTFRYRPLNKRRTAIKCRTPIPLCHKKGIKLVDISIVCINFKRLAYSIDKNKILR